MVIDHGSGLPVLDSEGSSVKARGYDRGQAEMITLTSIGNDQWMQVSPAEAFLKMQTDAKKDGIILRPNSGWRSFGHQQIFWDAYEEKLALWSRSPEVYKKPLRPARPGYSRHHMGVAVDINRSHDDPDGKGPELGYTDKWLLDNARKYGFYRTVPAELWHFEYLAVVRENEGVA